MLGDSRRVALRDGGAGRRVDRRRSILIVIVAEIGADQDQRPLVRHRLDGPRHLGGRGLAHHHRHDPHIAEHPLQEGQLDLQRMFLAVGLVIHLDEGQGPQGGQRRGILLQLSQWGGKGPRARQGDAAHRDPVGGAEDGNAGDPAAKRFQPGIDAGRDRAGIDVAGMRRNDRKGRLSRRRLRRGGQQRIDHGGEFRWPAGVELAGHRGGPHILRTGHAHHLPCLGRFASPRATTSVAPSGRVLRIPRYRPRFTAWPNASTPPR